MTQKTLKEGLPVTRPTRMPKTIITARIHWQGGSQDVKAVEIIVMVVDKMVPIVLVDEGSGLIISSEHTMRKLGLSLIVPSPFVINMANHTPTIPLGMIKDGRISTGGEEYVVTFYVINMHSNKDIFFILLDRPWLRMSDAIVDWGGEKPSITYGPKDNISR